MSRTAVDRFDERNAESAENWERPQPQPSIRCSPGTVFLSSIAAAHGRAKLSACVFPISSFVLFVLFVAKLLADIDATKDTKSTKKNLPKILLPSGAVAEFLRIQLRL